MLALALSTAALVVTLGVAYLGREQARLVRLGLRREWLMIHAIRTIELRLPAESRALVAEALEPLDLELGRQTEHARDRLRMPPPITEPWGEDRTSGELRANSVRTRGDAHNASGASGLFQFLPSTWNSTPFAGFSVWARRRIAAKRRA